MGVWDRSLRICKYLCDYGQQSVRHLAQQLGLSKSRVHRLRKARERRSGFPEAELWATAAGRQWLTRLVVAPLSTVGLKRGVGMDTLREFFVRLRLQPHLGCSPPALRGVRLALEKNVVETAQAWEQEGTPPGEGRASMGAVDDTGLEHMLLVFMDLPSGYLRVAEVAAERPSATWKAGVDERRKPLGATSLYLGSDRANALIQLAATGFECWSMPDFFHCVHDIVKSSALAIGRRLRHAPQELAHVERQRTSRLDRAPERQDKGERALLVEARRAAVQRGARGRARLNTTGRRSR